MRFPVSPKLLLMALVASMVPLVACEPPAPFQIRNNTGQTLNIFIAYTFSEHVDARDVREPAGSVETGQVLEPKGLIGMFEVYLIEARDSAGNIVYSKEFTARELRAAKWKVVISVNN